MSVKNNILELIGNTPLVKINNLNQGTANVFVKVEYFNPAGSIKDRVALKMIEDFEKQGVINKDTTIIEPTSGNTGIGLALVCAIKGYKLILTMPESMSKERRDILKAYGAKLVLTPAKDGMQGTLDEASKLHDEIKNSIIPQQFENASNPLTHYENTAMEIWNDLDTQVDIVVAGIGTGGTITGIGKKLKQLNPDIKAYGIEPLSSPLITEGHAGPHKIQGIGANFIPKNFDKTYVDDVFRVSDDDAINCAKMLATKEGIFCGISSGASLYQALELSKLEENKNKNIVAILPDTGMRYFSSPMFQ